MSERSKTSRFLGVSWDKSTGKWHARYNQKDLGYYQDEEKAGQVYQQYKSDIKSSINVVPHKDSFDHETTFNGITKNVNSTFKTFDSDVHQLKSTASNLKSHPYLVGGAVLLFAAGVGAVTGINSKLATTISSAGSSAFNAAKSVTISSPAAVSKGLNNSADFLQSDVPDFINVFGNVVPMDIDPIVGGGIPESTRMPVVDNAERLLSDIRQQSGALQTKLNDNYTSLDPLQSLATQIDRMGDIVQVGQFSGVQDFSDKFMNAPSTISKGKMLYEGGKALSAWYSKENDVHLKASMAETISEINIGYEHLVRTQGLRSQQDAELKIIQAEHTSLVNEVASLNSQLSSSAPMDVTNNFTDDQRQVGRETTEARVRMEAKLVKAEKREQKHKEKLSRTQEQLKSTIKQLKKQEDINVTQQIALGKQTQQALGNKRSHGIVYVTGQGSSGQGRIFHKQVSSRANAINRTSVNAFSTELRFDNKLPKNNFTTLGKRGRKTPVESFTIKKPITTENIKKKKVE